MGDRIKLAALVAVAVIAAGALGLIVYNYAANDWHFVGNPLDVSWMFGGEDIEEPADTRSSTRSMQFGDSVRAIRIRSYGLHIRLRGHTSPTIDLSYTLNGDATDTSMFTMRAVVDSTGTLAISALPLVRHGNASGSINISVPPSLVIEIASDQGSVALTGVTANATIQTISGSIEAVGMHGAVTCRSDTASIVLEGCILDSASLRTSGSVGLSLTQGRFVVDGGSIGADSHFGSLTARARNDIRAIILSDSAALEVYSEEGDVRLRVHDGAHVAFDVAAAGQIISNVTFDSLAEGMVTEHTLRATMNGGGPPATIRSVRGSVEILLFDPDEVHNDDINGTSTAQDTSLVRRAVRSQRGSARRALEGS